MHADSLEISMLDKRPLCAAIKMDNIKMTYSGAASAAMLHKPPRFVVAAVEGRADTGRLILPDDAARKSICRADAARRRSRRFRYRTARGAVITVGSGEKRQVPLDHRAF